MKYKVGDKVRIAQWYIDEFWYEQEQGDDMNWDYDAESIFEPGRVFTITNITYKNDDTKYFLDGGVGGIWGENLLTKTQTIKLPEELFEL